MNIDLGGIAGVAATALGSIALWLLNDAVTQLRGLRDSISMLNEKIAVVITRIDSHETRIASLERE